MTEFKIQCERCEKELMGLFMGDEDCYLNLEEIIEVRTNTYKSISKLYDLTAYFCLNCASKTIREIEGTV